MPHNHKYGRVIGYCSFLTQSKNWEDGLDGSHAGNDRVWILILHKISANKILQKWFQFYCCLPLLVQLRVISHILPRFFLLKPGETEICVPSLPLCEGVLATREEMRGKFLLSDARLYTIYDSL